MPVGADELDVAEKTFLDEIVGVLIEDAVVALVADGEEFFGLLGDFDHLLALGDVVSHELFAQDVLAARMASMARSAC